MQKKITLFFIMWGTLFVVDAAASPCDMLRAHNLELKAEEFNKKLDDCLKNNKTTKQEYSKAIKALEQEKAATRNATAKTEAMEQEYLKTVQALEQEKADVQSAIEKIETMQRDNAALAEELAKKKQEWGFYAGVAATTSAIFGLVLTGCVLYRYAKGNDSSNKGSYTSETYPTGSNCN